MAERKLNLDAPLMSVRRIASRPISPNARMVRSQVTEPVAVPFHWEHIPGRAKYGKPPHSHKEDEEDNEDAYSDALDTLSSHCSATGSDGGTFSTDPQTRDFMMDRFLPAAKAMALEPPRNYSAKKHPEQPRQVLRRVIAEENKPNMLVPQRRVYQKEEESDEESEDEQVHNEPQIITARGCGLFPRLCFRNSLTLLGPLPGLKVGSPKPTRTAYNQSLSKSVKKAWDSHKKKSESISLSAEQIKVGSEKKKNDESKRFTFSGELIGRLSPFRNSRAADTESTPKQKKADIRSRSGELGNKGRAVEAQRFTYSGELNRGRLSPLRNTIGSRSAEKFSGDLQRISSSPLRSTRAAATISPYRNHSPFRLRLPKDDTANAKPSFSSTPALDTADTYSYSRSAYLGSKPRFHSGEQLRRPRWLDEACAEFSFQDIKKLNSELALEILEQEVSDEDNKSSLFSVRRQQQVQSTDCSKLLSGKADLNADVDKQEDLLGVNSSLLQSPLPPPLPRSPSESWLWRTIPSISLRNSFGLKTQTKDLESKSSTKWETIVKTSKSRHDHARYSEELVAHISKQ